MLFQLIILLGMAAATSTGQTWAMPRCEDANCQRDDAEMMDTSAAGYDAPPVEPLDGALDSRSRSRS